MTYAKTYILASVMGALILFGGALSVYAQKAEFDPGPGGGASSDGLVPCGNGSDPSNSCTLCHLVTGIDNIIDWMMKVIFILTILMILVAGIIYITSAGNQSMITIAKAALKYALVGVLVFLIAWVLITWLFVSLAKNNASTGVYLSSGGAWDFTCDITRSKLLDEYEGGFIPGSGGGNNGAGGGGGGGGSTYDPDIGGA